MTQIPECRDHEDNVQDEHCWHPGGGGAQAPMSQRCCHCGLDFRIKQAPFVADQQHGIHGRHHQLMDYQLVFDTTYQDMYCADPKSFEELDKALEEGKRIRESLSKRMGNMRPRGF